jgi:hypothetical protein
MLPKMNQFHRLGDEKRKEEICNKDLVSATPADEDEHQNEKLTARTPPQ